MFEWLKQLTRGRKTMRQRLTILEGKLEERDSRIARLEATVAAYQRGASGRQPGCARCRHLLNHHRGPGGSCQAPGCACREYDSGARLPESDEPATHR